VLWIKTIGGAIMKSLKDRAKEWLNEKNILDNNPEASDSVYVMEEYEILLATAENMFKELIQEGTI
jgi:hypothetical protein